MSNTVLDSMENAVRQILSIPRYFQEEIIPNTESYYEVRVKDLESGKNVKCPFHGDVKSSFKYYPETRTFYCSMCKSIGNVIELHLAFMRMLNELEPTYEEAIEYLYDKYVAE